MIFNRYVLLGAVFAAVAIQGYAATSKLQPQRLRTEHMENPGVIGTHAPRLSWINQPVSAKVKNASQSASRIVVASSKENLESGIFDVWDSGKTAGEQAYLVEYAGKPLVDGQDYYWRVMVWDNDGNPSDWSETASWGMGFMDPSRWQARWIGAPWQGEGHKKTIDSKKSRRDYPAPLLRKEFEVKPGLKKAKAFVTGLGYFELHMNGEKVGDDMLVPNFTNYSKRPDLDQYSIVVDDNFTGYRVLYLAYNVTDMLQPGENAVGAILGNGFFDNTTGWVCPFGSPRLLCQLELTYEDGTTETIVTDDSWRASMSAIVADGPFDGEVYDARKEQKGWDTAGFDDSSWQRAAYRKAPYGELTAHTSPTDKVMGSFAPTSLTRNADGSWEVTFPAEISGWIRLKDVEAAAGDTIEIKYYCDQPLGVHRYISNGEGTVDYAPRFTWYVFSKANIKGPKTLTEKNLVAEAVNTNLGISSDFTASNALL
ncbi:MAG: alpha-L-rhamnosidase N-terminal domain-containing protein, partial [Muribaculaceae bacterium]|nr:alpha-L-rhamnosidase N-terminal domain-containing protein [Muribaculaceae bacterium]